MWVQNAYIYLDKLLVIYSCRQTRMHAKRASLIRALPMHPSTPTPLQQNLQACPFSPNNFQASSPATLLLSTPCIAARAWRKVSSAFTPASTLTRLLAFSSFSHYLESPFTKSFICHTSAKSLAKSFPCHTSKNPLLQVLYLPHIQAPPGVSIFIFSRAPRAPETSTVNLIISVLLCLLLAVTASPAAASQSAGQTETLLSNARDLLEKGNLTEADRAVREYLQSHPDSADGHFLLGHILFREISSKWLEAGKAEGEALLYNTGDLSGPLVSYRDAKAKESLAEFTAGAKYHVPAALDLKIVALDYLLLKDNNDADHWLTRSLQADPRDAQAWYYLGRTKYGKGQFTEAIEAFAQCLKLEPRNIKAETNVGLSYEALERADEAAQAFQNAIAWQAESPAKDPEPFIELGHLFVNQNHPEKAVPYLMQSIAILPKISKAHEELGRAYSLLNKFPEAQAELERAIELTPLAPNLHCLLAPVYRKQGLADKAKAESDRCAALSGAHSTS